VREAIALGLVQGPAELAPVSSSAHIAILRRSPSGDPLVAAQRKSLEVAVHGAGAAALALSIGPRLLHDWRRMAAAGPRRRARRLATLTLSLAPPALAGYVLEQPIERRLGGPGATAAGLALGAGAMALADRRPATRTLRCAGPLDGVVLGLAQATALMPGVSRRGATLAAARARGFSRADADALSWLAGLPLIAGACLLKGARLLREQRSPKQLGELLAGGLAAFASTLAAARTLEATDLGNAPLMPFSAYRFALALVLLRRRRRTS
jgi:undecaprenyl-diphosphatase